MSLALMLFVEFSSSVSAAPFTSYFDSLIAELTSREAALSDSTDSLEIKQRKAATKALTALNKDSDSLSKDLKSARKVARILFKAYPEEFTLPAASFTPFSDLFTELFGNLGSEVSDALAAVDEAASGVTNEGALAKIQAKIDAALASLETAQSETNFVAKATDLLKALAQTIQAEKLVAKNTGGGSGNAGISATVFIGGTNYLWSANGGAEWVQGSGILDIGGDDGLLKVSAALCSGFNGTAGTYSLENNCGGVFHLVNITFYGATSGTLYIQSFNAATHSLSGTFSFSAANGVTVMDGQFNLTNLGISP